MQYAPGNRCNREEETRVFQWRTSRSSAQNPGFFSAVVYNSLMTNEPLLRLQDARLHHLAVYLVVIALVGISLVLLREPWAIGTIIILCLAFALVHRLGMPAVQTRRQATLYLVVQTVVVTGICLAAGSGDPFNFPFFVLSIQAMLFVPPRMAAGWVLAFYLVGCATVAIRQGGIGPVYLLFYLTAFVFAGVYGYTLRQAEIARRHNAQLLAELQVAQQKLHDLAVAEERNRLARDLHDSTKQQAFALSAQLDAVRSLLYRDPVAAERHLQQAEGLADTLRQELAAMILDLRPPALGEEGLVVALEQYTSGWSRRHAIVVTLQMDRVKKLPPIVEQTLFRIVQEALANVARHSRAKQVTVQLQQTSEQMRLTIRDGGCGFDPQQVRAGLGLHSMRERADALPQGMFTVTSQPGQGTEVVIVWRR